MSGSPQMMVKAWDSLDPDKRNGRDGEHRGVRKL